MMQEHKIPPHIYARITHIVGERNIKYMLRCSHEPFARILAKVPASVKTDSILGEAFLLLVAQDSTTAGCINHPEDIYFSEIWVNRKRGLMHLVLNYRGREEFIEIRLAHSSQVGWDQEDLEEERGGFYKFVDMWSDNIHKQWKRMQ